MTRRELFFRGLAAAALGVLGIKLNPPKVKIASGLLSLSVGDGPLVFGAVHTAEHGTIDCRGRHRYPCVMYDLPDAPARRGLSLYIPRVHFKREQDSRGKFDMTMTLPLGTWSQEFYPDGYFSTIKRRSGHEQAFRLANPGEYL